MRQDAQPQGVAGPRLDPRQQHRAGGGGDADQPVGLGRLDPGGDQRPGLARAQPGGQVGVGQQFGQRPAVDGAAGLHQHHRIGQPQHLGDGMADVKDRQADIVAQAFQPGHDLGLAVLVQRGKGLVQHQKRRVRQQRPADGDALALAPRQRRGAAVQQSAQAQHLHDAVEIPRGVAPPARGIAQVRCHRHVRKQPRVLEHAADAARLRRQVGLVVEQHPVPQRDAAAVGAQKPQDGVDRGGLAAARGAEQRRHPGRRLERHLQRQAGKAVAIGDGQAHRAIRRARNSDTSTAASAIATEISTSRIAGPSPEGVESSA